MCSCEYVYLYLYKFLCQWECVYIYIYIYIYIFISVFSFDLFTLYSHFYSDLRDHNENKVFLPVSASHYGCYLYLSSVISQLHFYILTFNQFVSLFLLGYYLDLKCFLIFRALYSFLWLLFMAK